MKAIAIITARGGSKRIPKKNIKDFCGKPIIAYTVEAALQSGLFDEVMVSTDSEEIAEVARKYGAKVPFMRSEATSNDFATTADVLREVVEQYAREGKTFAYFACLYPTAPFLTSKRLRDAWDTFLASGADTLMPVVKFSFPPQRGVVIREGRMQYNTPEFANCRSQDLEPIYHDCGQFYLLKTEAFCETGAVVGRNTVPYVMPEELVQDIDDIADWNIAEIKYKRILSKTE